MGRHVGLLDSKPNRPTTMAAIPSKDENVATVAHVSDGEHSLEKAHGEGPETVVPIGGEALEESAHHINLSWRSWVRRCLWAASCSCCGCLTSF